MKRLLSVSCGAAACLVLTLSLTGCGGSSGGKDGPEPIPVVNPDPNNPLKDVGLENEAQNLDKIRAGTVPAKQP